MSRQLRWFANTVAAQLYFYPRTRSGQTVIPTVMKSADGAECLNLTRILERALSPDSFPQWISTTDVEFDRISSDWYLNEYLKGRPLVFERKEWNPISEGSNQGFIAQLYQVGCEKVVAKPGSLDMSSFKEITIQHASPTEITFTGFSPGEAFGERELSATFRMPEGERGNRLIVESRHVVTMIRECAAFGKTPAPFSPERKADLASVTTEEHEIVETKEIHFKESLPAYVNLTARLALLIQSGQGYQAQPDCRTRMHSPFEAALQKFGAQKP